MKKPEYLERILLEKCFKPRYYPEETEYLLGKEFSPIALPMTCFCDVLLNKLVFHAYNYGYYGIGLYKKWDNTRFLQPIQYINEKSILNSRLNYAFKLSIENDDENNEFADGLKQYLFQEICFKKPLQGIMEIDRKPQIVNFTDDREWRYVPDLSNLNTELDAIILPSKVTRESLELYNKAISKLNEATLKFRFNDIKYLIVKSIYDKDRFTEFIINKLPCDDKQKYNLISRIVILEEINEDCDKYEIMKVKSNS